jgi:hypothetical protein
MSVSNEIYDQIGATAKKATSATSNNGSVRHNPRWMDDWVKRFCPTAAEAVGTRDGGRKWILSACLFNPDHKAPDAAFIEKPDGTLGYHCFHASCSDRDWQAARDLMEPGWRARKRPKQTLSDDQAAPSQRRRTAPTNDENYEINEGIEGSESSSDSSNSSFVGGRHWPEALAEEAYHGVVGDIVRKVEPLTESDPVTILVSLLVELGNLIGPRPHHRVGATRHGLNEYAVVVGNSARARKGTGGDVARELGRRIDSVWEAGCIAGGMGSGEGIVHRVRDAAGKDPGIDDKRLLLMETEFAGPLNVMSRAGNILSVTLRQAWDKGTLENLVKNAPSKASGTHISLLGHVTQFDLTRFLTDTEMGNGFANRISWFCVRRSRLLAIPPTFPRLNQEVQRLKQAVDKAKELDGIRWHADAQFVWERIYPILTRDEPGMFGVIISRGEVHTLRYALIFAALDGSYQIRIPHLLAALAVWSYAEQSAHYLFGDTMGDPVADTVWNVLRARGELTRSEVYGALGNNAEKAAVDRVLRILIDQRRVALEERDTGGKRKTEVWKVADGHGGTGTGRSLIEIARAAAADYEVRPQDEHELHERNEVLTGVAEEEFEEGVL